MSCVDSNETSCFGTQSILRLITCSFSKTASAVAKPPNELFSPFDNRSLCTHSVASAVHLRISYLDATIGPRMVKMCAKS